MRRGAAAARCAGAALLAFVTAVTPAAAQQEPTVSRAVEQGFQRDSVVALWLFALPQYPLEQVAAAVAQAGGRERRRSEWLHAVSADVTRSALAALRRSPLLRHIQPVTRFRGSRPPPATPASGVAGPWPAPAAQDSLYGPSAMPFRRLHLFPLVDRGYRGSGVRIAILDTGFETGLAPFASANVVEQFDFVFNDSIVRNEPGRDAAGASAHGTATWSLLAANDPGKMIGIAPDAEYLLAKTEDVRSETHMEEDNYVAALEWAAARNAQVVSSSLGYLVFQTGGSYTQDQLNGDIAVTTVAADIAAQRGITVVTAVGNGGPGSRTLETPGDGDSVIAVGAEDSVGTLAFFSSRGPTADGRIKPDVVAPGVAVWVLDTAGSYVRLNGTSFATPIIAGAAALLREAHPQLTGVDVRNALRGAGANASMPNNDRGWGLPDAYVAATFPFGLAVASPQDSVFGSVTPAFSWNAPGLASFGQPVQYHLTVTRADTSPAPTLLDTTLQATQVTLTTAQRPGRRLTFALRATAADSATLTIPAGTQYVIPPWADLITLDAPSGSTIHDPRPVLRWTTPAVLSPPGPFTFDVEIFQTGDKQVVQRATGLDTTAFAPPTDLELNTPYRWRVRSHLGGDTATTESQGAFLVADESVPPVTLLFQNFPNPFPNPAIGLTATCIWFDLARGGRVRLEILDLRGHRVRTLIPSPSFSDLVDPGRYGRPGGAGGGQCDPRLVWDGRSEDEEFVMRGIYLVKLVTPDGTFFRRMVFLGPS